MKIINSLRTILYLLSILFLASTWPAYALKDNVSITGNLVTEPCSLDPASTLVPLNFGTLVSKYFYTNFRTPGETFTLTLLDCDLTIGQGVMLKFMGTESVMPGLLAPDSGDTRGIAIGIESEDGSMPILLNQETGLYSLAKGKTVLPFKGYVAGEPEAIKNHAIIAGPFIATATFELIYP